MPNHNIIDISLPINPNLMVYPGNPIVEFSDASSTTSDLTKLSLGSHTGTHIDAPRHSKVSDAGVDTYALEAFIGTARVIDATHESEYISVKTIEESEIKEGERVLFKTQNSIRGFQSWRSDYIYLHGDTAELLAKKKIKLFGLDWISVKQQGNPDNRAHTGLLENNIPIIEGLDLSMVFPGEYQLIFLPLNLGNLDGAPGRAVLIK